MFRSILDLSTSMIILHRDPEMEPGAVREMIDSKHREYARKTTIFKRVYYLTRLMAGLSAGVLPFVVNANPSVATGLAVAIVVVTVLDIVFDPKSKWALYSKATDFLTVARLKLSGDYEKYKQVIDLLVETESKELELLVPLQRVIQDTQNAAAGGKTEAERHS